MKYFRVCLLAACLGLLTSYSPAFAASNHTVFKPGEICAKAKLGKTTKDGKLSLVCQKVGKHDRWEKKITTTTTTTIAKSTTTTTSSIPTLYSPAGNLYRAGEFCSVADLGLLDHGSTGIIKCENDAGYDRWVYP
jgi:hypothetical protein